MLHDEVAGADAAGAIRKAARGAGTTALAGHHTAVMALFAAEIVRARTVQQLVDIQKNRCRTTVVEPIWETPAELPLSGDQVVCLGRNQAAWSGPASATGKSM
jgi:hypothetical protein